jgi:hypothetical protein
MLVDCSVAACAIWRSTPWSQEPEAFRLNGEVGRNAAQVNNGPKNAEPAS